jgi:hypothetical protein
MPSLLGVVPHEHNPPVPESEKFDVERELRMAPGHYGLA